MKRRVVVTGMGIWSSIGQDLQTVTESLKHGRSGIIFDPKRVEYGLQSGLVGNVPRPDLKPLLPRKFRTTMSEDAEYAFMVAHQAFEQSGITDEYLHKNEVGIIFGSDYQGFEHIALGRLRIDEFLFFEHECREKHTNECDDREHDEHDTIAPREPDCSAQEARKQERRVCEKRTDEEGERDGGRNCHSVFLRLAELADECVVRSAVHRHKEIEQDDEDGNPSDVYTADLVFRRTEQEHSDDRKRNGGPLHKRNTASAS